MRDRGLIEIIATFALMAIVVVMFSSLLGPLVIVALALIAAYGIYQIVKYTRRKIRKKIDESRFDEQGRRYTKISVLEVKDLDGDREDKVQ